MGCNVTQGKRNWVRDNRSEGAFEGFLEEFPSKERILEELEKNAALLEGDIATLTQNKGLLDSARAEFDAADNDTKKMILARLIEKITVDKDYHLRITFYVAADSFRTQVTQEKPLIRIDEAERCIPAVAV